MPHGDRRGPNGKGSMTGRAAGYCTGSGAPGYGNPVLVRGGGGFRGGCTDLHGRGRGQGNRNMFLATGLTGWQRVAAGFGSGMSPKQELAALRSQMQSLEEAKKSALDRIAELEKSEEAKE